MDRDVKIGEEGIFTFVVPSDFVPLIRLYSKIPSARLYSKVYILELYIEKNKMQQSSCGCISNRANQSGRNSGFIMLSTKS